MTTASSTHRQTVLITGGSGFIGGYVADEFLSQGWNVVILSKTGGDSSTLRSDMVFVQGRVGDRAALDEAFGYGIHGVVHLACSSVPSTADATVDVTSNLVESLALLEHCRIHQVRKVVLASSGGTVYGIPRTVPITEESTTDPICSYGIVKLALEKYFELYSRLHAISCVALRISNPYGPGQSPNRPQGVVSVFAAKMLQGKPLTLWGDGTVVRDFVHVRDLARLFFLAMVTPASGVYNAGSGVGLSINTLIATIGRELRVLPEVTRLPARACDVPVSVLGCRKARDTFGWRPEIPMERGIQQVGSWLLHEVLPATTQHVFTQSIFTATRIVEGVA